MLGLPLDWMDLLTMEEFNALAERHREQEKRWDIRADMMPSIYINAHTEKNARKVRPGENFGHYQPAKQQSDQSMLEFMRAMTDAHNKQIASEG